MVDAVAQDMLQRIDHLLQRRAIESDLRAAHLQIDRLSEPGGQVARAALEARHDR